MKCEKCSHDIIIVEITDGEKTIRLCPNCVAVSFLNDELIFCMASTGFKDVASIDSSCLWIREGYKKMDK